MFVVTKYLNESVLPYRTTESDVYEWICAYARMNVFFINGRRT